MKLIIGGVRGTNPVGQPDYMKYGGETTSFLVEGDAGERVLIDAGTGTRKLGQHLEQTHKAADVLLLLTHYHLDHVMGLPSLSLIYKEHWTIEIASPVRQGLRVDEVMPRIFNKPFWPLQVEELGSHVRFKTLDSETSLAPLRYGKLEIRWCPLHHPGGSTAYRIDEPASGASLVIATDMEWAESSPTEQSNLLKLADHASLLAMDGQFTPEDYAEHRGWGHSTWKECCDVARHAAVEKLLVTHHAPSRNDDALANVEDDLRACCPAAALAREGLEITVAGRGSSSQQ
jgi:ribonuclease BN (tRNA processing enzyme)